MVVALKVSAGNLACVVMVVGWQRQLGEIRGFDGCGGDKRGRGGLYGFGGHN
jgi:hypothetical protein